MVRYTERPTNMKKKHTHTGHKRTFPMAIMAASFAATMWRFRCSFRRLTRFFFSSAWLSCASFVSEGEGERLFLSSSACA
jgi:hypothetical protein